MSSVQDSPLDLLKNEIRLFTLFPCENDSSPAPWGNLDGPDSDPSSHRHRIRGTLKTHSLDDELSYVALSYTWGEETPTTTIQVDDRTVTVRANLGTALQYLRQPDQPTTLWIDAICIDQSDEGEKSAQVRKMRDIYTKATKVLAWLGPPEDDGDMVMEWLENAGKEAIEAGILDFHNTDVAGWFEHDEGERVRRIKVYLNNFVADKDLENFYLALIAFSNRSFWTRVWVLQEISLARDVIIMCGSKRVTYPTFAAALSFKTINRWMTIFRFALSDWNDPVKGHIHRHLTGKVPSIAPSALIGIQQGYQRETGVSESLQDLLERTCIDADITLFQATDARDKIYGLLGLASDSDRLGIVPDYSKSVVEVYANVARALIADGKTTILSWCQQSQTRIERLPSWVPDFSSLIRQPCGEFEQIGTTSFCASGNRIISPSPILRSADKNLLSLLGTRIGTVAELGTAWEPEWDTRFNREAARQLLIEVENFCNRSALLLPVPERLVDAKMRIPCADQADNDTGRSRAVGSIREKYEFVRWPQENSSATIVPNQSSYEVAMDNQHNRKPFLSAGGHVGLAPKCAQPGDLVVILFGFTVPYILRDLLNGEFQLIGEAYVYGIMDGELITEDKSSDEVFHLC